MQFGIWVIEVGKDPKNTRLNDQVAQCDENNAKINIAKVEDGELTTLSKEVQLEISLDEVAFLTKPTYKVGIRIRLVRTVLHLTTSLLDT